MSIFSSLRREQKEAVGLLSIGTFLEYFDLYLYVHMAVLLNELFFPKTDHFTASLLAAFAFCSTYFLRPFGAFIFGYIGDHIGRKPTVVITTMLMAICCIVMANAPTYDQVGISAAWIVTICRILQGISSMGEITGAELYLLETTTPPIRYPMVTSILCFAVLGGTAALAMAAFITYTGLSWRIAFWVGAVIALTGTFARTVLRETPDFANAKKRIKEILKESKQDPNILNKQSIYDEKVNKKTMVALFLIQCAWPVCFYFSYIYCGNILKTSFGFTPEQIIQHNFIVSIIQLASYYFVAYLTYKVYPLHILKVKMIVFPFIMLVCPFVLNNLSSPFELMLLQLSIIFFFPSDLGGVAIFYTYFPILKRFTYACGTYAFARSLISVVTSFGLVYLVSNFGNWGIWIIMTPILLGYKFGLSHFEKLEKESGNYPKSRIFSCKPV